MLAAGAQLAFFARDTARGAHNDIGRILIRIRLAPSAVTGHTNFDGTAHGADFGHFVLALLDSANYGIVAHECNVLKADANHGGTFTTNNAPSPVAILPWAWGGAGDAC